MLTIQQATRQYERWVGRQVTLLPADLRSKHRRMRSDPFSFLRATFYRWIQRHDERLADLRDPVVVLGVGDLHIENFGTWRDGEGRLVWGINDFDEADRLPYTNDLVRLATSAALAHAMGRLRLRAADSCEAILRGYREALKVGGRPLVLAEQHEWLREAATTDLRDPVRFWKKLIARPKRAGLLRVPAHVRDRLRRALPRPMDSFGITHRRTGLGSLGRPRYLAVGRWHGGWVAREARALTASAVQWARDSRLRRPAYRSLLARSVRAPDPFVTVRGAWLVRRLAPDCSRIELESLPARYDEYRLMHAMGWETANVHLGSAQSGVLVTHVRSLGKHWLAEAVATMASAVREDWEAF